jgi:hypothetical protein
MYSYFKKPSRRYMLILYNSQTIKEAVTIEE